MAEKYDLTPEETAKLIEVATILKKASLNNGQHRAGARVYFKAGRLLDIPVRYTCGVSEENAASEEKAT